jgi:protein tyrosine phosphatase
MAFENKTNLIIMLCPCKEDDKQMSSDYIPSSKEEDRTYGNYKVKLLAASEPFKDLFLRDLEVTEVASGEIFFLRHLQETEWKDNKAPSPSPEMEQKVLYLLAEIKASREKHF